MKKYVLAGLALIMCLAMGMTAMAAPSITSRSLPAGEVQDAAGKTIKIEIAVPTDAIITSATNTETVKATIGSEFKESMEVIDVVEVAVPEDTQFPVTITFKVAGVKAGATVYVMHWNGNSWDKINATAGDGTITATFTSLSPVAFVVDSATNSAAGTTGTTDTTGTTSPKTADANLAVVGVMAVLAFAGICIINRKKVQA